VQEKNRQIVNIGNAKTVCPQHLALAFMKSLFFIDTNTYFFISLDQLDFVYSEPHYITAVLI